MVLIQVPLDVAVFEQLDRYPDAITRFEQRYRETGTGAGGIAQIYVGLREYRSRVRVVAADG